MTLAWYQDVEATEMFVNWETFAKALQIKFGTTTYDDPMEPLTRLRQSSIVVVYKW